MDNTGIKTEGFPKWDIINNEYLVSTAHIPDIMRPSGGYYETMVFPCDVEKLSFTVTTESVIINEEAVDFGNPREEFTVHYDNDEDAVKGHRDICSKLAEEKA